MDGYISDIGLYLLAPLVVGAAVGWLSRSALSKSAISQLNDDWEAQYDDAVRQRDRLSTETTTLRTTVEAQEAVVHQRDLAVRKTRTELDSALEKEKLLMKNIFTLRAEREDFKTKVAMFQNALTSLKRQSTELQTEFVKSGDFYKAELAKSFEKVIPKSRWQINPLDLWHLIAKGHPGQLFLEAFAFVRVRFFCECLGQSEEPLLFTFLMLHALFDQLTQDFVGAGSPGLRHLLHLAG